MSILLKITEALILATLLLTPTSGSLTITEIMYNPPGTDAHREWIEVYNNGAEEVNISTWKLHEENTNHQLTAVSTQPTPNNDEIISPGEYATIAESPEQFLTDYPQYVGTLIDTYWSSLSNTGEFLALQNLEGMLTSNLTYNSTWGGDGNNKTLEKTNTGDSNNPGEWGESKALGGTPGSENSINEETTTTVMTTASTTTISTITTTSTTFTTTIVSTTTIDSTSTTSTSTTTEATTTTSTSSSSTCTTTSSSTSTTSELGTTTTTISSTTSSTSSTSSTQQNTTIIQTSTTTSTSTTSSTSSTTSSSTSSSTNPSTTTSSTSTTNSSTTSTTSSSTTRSSTITSSTTSTQQTITTIQTSTSHSTSSTTTTTTPGETKIAINEIMYDPCAIQGPDGQYEYIELYNYGPDPVDLKGWTLSDDGSDFEALKGFNNTDTIIPPDGYAIVTDDDSLVRIPSTAIHLSTGDSSICTNGLSNTGEPIRLSNPYGLEIDSIAYSSSWGGNGNCKSLEKKNAEEENEQYNWGESITSGGTPGDRNSVYGLSTTTSTSTTTFRATTTTYIKEKCSDGTALGNCSKNKPKYCFDGVLVLRCSKCGCPKGYDCIKDECVKQQKENKTKEKVVKPDEKVKESSIGEAETAKQGAKSVISEMEQSEPKTSNLDELEVEEDDSTEESNSFTGSAIFSKAATPKAAGAIALSAIFGIYLLRKKRRQDSNTQNPDLYKDSNI